MEECYGFHVDVVGFAAVIFGTFMFIVQLVTFTVQILSY